jgi:diguanylate cyclase (GGDEF)-like protein
MTIAPFGNCKLDDLHLGNRIQSFGGLLAVDRRTQWIVACSQNIETFIGKSPAELLGQPQRVAFSTAQAVDLLHRADRPGPHVPHIQRMQLNHQSMLVATHSVADCTLFEIEASETQWQAFGFSDRVVYLQALAGTKTADSAAQLLFEHIADITQYDRVMLYKFLPEWHGEVIAERLKPGVHGFLGLRFPATDLPANARRLYLINWQRIIADVHADTVAVRALPGHELIDFSYSQLRAVHPVHIEYLQNLGVEASFSVSIIVAGQLWGLVLCHHMAAKALSMNQRQLCEDLARTASLHMSDMVALQLTQERSSFRAELAKILGGLGSDTGNRRGIVSQLTHVGRAFRADGILAHVDGQDFHSGSVPDDISLSALRDSLVTYDRSAVAVRSRISPSLEQYPSLSRFACGTLYIPLTDQDFLLLLRSEQISAVKWAGKPQCYSDTGEEITQLTPRASFQGWSEQVRGSSEPWDQIEIESAQRLRQLLIEHTERLRLESLALRDPLTGLANRFMFERALQEAIKRAIKDDALTAVFVLDLDKFKPVNDTLGHAAGDALLTQVGERLIGLMRSRDTVARLGGDEFGIVALDLSHAADADRTAERILEEIRRPFIIQSHSVEIGVSIGISMCPIDAIEHGELLEDADLALYQAKDAGRNTFKAFTNGMALDAQQKGSARHALIEAMHGGTCSFVFQPIVASKTKTLHSFEAFARWQHPIKGELAACDFLPTMEQSQLLAQFAEWGIATVLRQGRDWMRKALPLVPVSINVSARQFFSLDLVGICSDLAREFDIGLEWLRFDLDATALQADFAQAAAKIAALARLGILTNIDHFGQGLVPLNRLCDLKIAQLKVTGDFFKLSKDVTKADALIAIVHEIGRALRVPIVATQLETTEMEGRATFAGIEYLQGYCISLPLKCDAAEEWLRINSSR